MSTLIIDLDHTLLDTTTFKQTLAKSLNLTTEQWDTVYERFVKDYGRFEPKAFLEGVEPLQKKNFFHTLKQLSHFLYPDSLTFLEHMLANGWQVIILTYGNPAWQQLKLEHLPIPTEVRCVTTDQSKHLMMTDLIEPTTIVIDDNGVELDAIKTAFPQIKAYWLQRSNGKYQNASLLADHKIDNLNIKL